MKTITNIVYPGVVFMSSCGKLHDNKISLGYFYKLIHLQYKFNKHIPSETLFTLLL